MSGPYPDLGGFVRPPLRSPWHPPPSPRRRGTSGPRHREMPGFDSKLGLIPPDLATLQRVVEGLRRL
jgi:hypothetical protein